MKQALNVQCEIEWALSTPVTPSQHRWKPGLEKTMLMLIMREYRLKNTTRKS